MPTLSSADDIFPLVDLGEQSLVTSDPPYAMSNTPPPPPISGQYDFNWVEYMDDLTGVQTSWSDDRAFLPTTTVYSLTFVLGILGNGFVILALLSGWRVGRTNEGSSVTSSFLISLAVADLLFLLVCVPFEMTAKLAAVWAGGLVLCKLAGFVEMLSATSSVINLTAVSVERYAVIVHPMKSRSWCSIGRTKKIICGIWVASVLLSAPLLHFMDTWQVLYYNNASYVTIMTCADSNFSSDFERISFAWYQLTVLFVFPVVVMCFCYSFVVAVLWVSTKEHARLTQSSEPATTSAPATAHNTTGSGNELEIVRIKTSFRVSRVKSGQNPDVRAARRQVIKMLLTIIIVFFVCWGPKLVVNVMKRFELSMLHSETAFFIKLTTDLLPYVQSCANPVIYSFMSQSFRRRVRAGWSQFRRCCRRDRDVGGFRTTNYVSGVEGHRLKKAAPDEAGINK